MARIAKTKSEETIKLEHAKRSELQKVFGENLESLRKQKNLSRKELADAIGITETSLGAYAQGRRSPTLDKIWHLAVKLDCSIGELLGDVPIIPDDERKVQAAIKILREAGLVPLLLTEDALVVLNNSEEAATND